MGYDKEQLDEMMQRVDLLDYASREFEFRRAGNDSYCALCNKHKDVNASLFITPSKQRWYCFGCKKGGDLLSWMRFYDGLTFEDAVKKLSQLTGTEIKHTTPASSMQFFKSFKRLHNEKASVERQVLSSDYLDQFEIPPEGEPHEWLADGITPEMIRRFGIRLDSRSNRIVYPVYDANDNLIGVKGRTRFENYKLLGLTKYINYQKIGTTDYFQGMHENRENVIRKNEAIIVEGLKSVMLLTGWGYDNAISAETSKLNDGQIKALLRLDISNVTLAFDKDVSIGAAMLEARKLSRFMNTYIVYDNEGLLGPVEDKCSPPDKGREVWEKLYGKRIRLHN